MLVYHSLALHSLSWEPAVEEKAYARCQMRGGGTEWTYLHSWFCIKSKMLVSYIIILWIPTFKADADQILILTTPGSEASAAECHVGHHGSAAVTCPALGMSLCLCVHSEDYPRLVLEEQGCVDLQKIILSWFWRSKAITPCCGGWDRKIPRLRPAWATQLGMEIQKTHRCFQTCLAEPNLKAIIHFLIV